MQSRSEQVRISQLISHYSPEDPPRAALDFGDYLSLAWRYDRSAGQLNREKYYRQCMRALSDGLGLTGHSLCRLVDSSEPGQIYRQLPNLPYRSAARLVDAQDRKAAIAQLLALRDDTLRIGTYQESWGMGFPGSGILETELRERVFAVLFTALQGQYNSFGRLLLVVDIVLTDLLLGFEHPPEVAMSRLIADCGYPDPDDPRVRQSFTAVSA